MIGMEIGVLGVLVLLLVVVAALIFLLYLVPIPLWIAAWASGAYVGLLTLIGMRLRRVPPATVVTARISAAKAGLDVSINDLEAHYLAGGNVVNVVNAMISADKANIPLPLKRAAGEGDHSELSRESYFSLSCRDLTKRPPARPRRPSSLI